MYKVTFLHCTGQCCEFLFPGARVETVMDKMIFQDFKDRKNQKQVKWEEFLMIWSKLGCYLEKRTTFMNPSMFLLSDLTLVSCFIFSNFKIQLKTMMLNRFDAFFFVLSSTDYGCRMVVWLLCCAPQIRQEEPSCIRSLLIINYFPTHFFK